jgi:hypothetical protein
MHAQPASFGSHQPQAAQDAQMLRDRRLADPQAGSQGADTQRLIARLAGQDLKQPHPRRVGQHGKERGHIE